MTQTSIGFEPVHSNKLFKRNKLVRLLTKQLDRLLNYKSTITLRAELGQKKNHPWYFWSEILFYSTLFYTILPERTTSKVEEAGVCQTVNSPSEGRETKNAQQVSVYQ